MSSQSVLARIQEKTLIRLKKLLSKKNGFLSRGDILENISTAVDEYCDILEAELQNKRSDD